MKDNTIRLFTIRGIPVGLDPSWFLVFALITWALAGSYFPVEFKHWTQLQYWSVAALTSVLFFATVLLHELAHSILALYYKLQVKSISLYIFGGISQITSEPTSAISEFVISLVGPLTSLALGGLFYLLELGFRGVAPIYAMTKYLALINITLAIFNLIPGYPLDGGRVFQAIVWGITHDVRKATRIAILLGRGIAFLFILLGVWQIFRGSWANGLWIAFIGWFMDNAAVGQVQQQRMHDLMAGHTVDQVMSRSCQMVTANLSLQALVDEYILDRGQRCLIVIQGDHPAGLLTVHHIREIPREQWSTTSAWQAMTPMDKVKQIGPKVGLEQALEQMGTDGVNQLPVMDNGQVQGMLSREDIVNYLRTLQNLGK